MCNVCRRRRSSAYIPGPNSDLSELALGTRRVSALVCITPLRHLSSPPITKCQSLHLRGAKHTQNRIQIINQAPNKLAFLPFPFPSHSPAPFSLLLGLSVSFAHSPDSPDSLFLLYLMMSTPRSEGVGAEQCFAKYFPLSYSFSFPHSPGSPETFESLYKAPALPTHCNHQKHQC